MAWSIVKPESDAIRFRIGFGHPVSCANFVLHASRASRVSSGGDLSAITILLKVAIKRATLRNNGLAVDVDNRGSGVPLASRTKGDELPFSVHLAILFKVYRMMLRLNSVLSLSLGALAGKSARKSSPAGIL